MDELRNFNAPKLYAKLALPDSEFENWLIDMELLPRSRTCGCGGSMNFKKKDDRKYPTGAALLRIAVKRLAICQELGLRELICH